MSYEITVRQWFPGGGWTATIPVPQEWYDARCGGMVGLQGGAMGQPPFVKGNGRIPSEALEAAEAALGRCALAFLNWSLYRASPEGSIGHEPP